MLNLKILFPFLDFWKALDTVKKQEFALEAEKEIGVSVYIVYT